MNRFMRCPSCGSRDTEIEKIRFEIESERRKERIDKISSEYEKELQRRPSTKVLKEHLERKSKPYPKKSEAKQIDIDTSKRIGDEPEG